MLRYFFQLNTDGSVRGGTAVETPMPANSLPPEYTQEGDINVWNSPNLATWDATAGKFVIGTPDPAKTLQGAKDVKIAQLQGAFSTTLTSGFTSSATGTAHQYGYNAQNQRDMSDEMLAVSTGIATFPIKWGMPDGTVLDHDATQFKALATDANAFKWGLVNKVRGLVAQVNAATTVDAVNAIVW